MEPDFTIVVLNMIERGEVPYVVADVTMRTDNPHVRENLEMDLTEKGWTIVK